ncbi:MAG: astB [Verrucomicrobia bacterium]|nr:astB [Verrucomicrobiota bacterium]
MSATFEVNFDGIVGPTHNYAGLSEGNLASTSNRGDVSHPRAAALQGLAKMKALADLGLKQAVFPPQARPDLEALRRSGFQGADIEVLGAAGKKPALLAACSSASSMWAANAATVTPSSDSGDGRVHFTPANLVSTFHRSIEPPQTARMLRAIFRDQERFIVHDPVDGQPVFADEGAANHTRFTPSQGKKGLHFFVYGQSSMRGDPLPGPQRFPARQAREASEIIARRHGLTSAMTVFARQHPDAIDAGVFHNDVISTGHENVFLHHEQAFAHPVEAIDSLRQKYAALHRGAELVTIQVPAARVSLADAVRSYLFNSQIVTVAPGRMLLVAAAECEAVPPVRHWIDELLQGGRTPIREVRYFDLKESMRNGGGPACLRLRVVLTEAELAALPPKILLTDETYAALVSWVNRHYREHLGPSDLADPALLEESRRALDELTHLLGLGAIYPK